MSAAGGTEATGDAVEIITDHGKLQGEEPLVTVRTGQTGGQKFFLRVKQPKGRALLIAVHL